MDYPHAVQCPSAQAWEDYALGRGFEFYRALIKFLSVRTYDKSKTISTDANDTARRLASGLARGFRYIILAVPNPASLD
jgi:hypothetical protein